MASSDALPVPRKNVAYRVIFPILDADGDLVTGAAGLDSEISKDQGTFADCTNEATEIATSSGMYYLDLTSGEMNADCVAIIVKTSTSGAKTTPIVLYPQESGDIKVDVQSWLTAAVNALASGRVDAIVGAYASGQAPLQPTVAGRTLDVSVGGEAGVDWANVGSPTTANNLSGTQVASVNGNVGGNVAGSVASVTGNVGGSVASVTGNVGGSVASVTGNVGGSVASIAAGGISASSIAAAALTAAKFAAGAVDANALATDAVNEVRDAIFARAFSAAYGGFTFDELVKLFAAALLAKCSGMGTATGTFRNLNDSANAIVATIDASGNRGAVTLTP